MTPKLIPLADAMALVEALETADAAIVPNGVINRMASLVVTEALSAFRAKHGGV